MFYKNFCAAVFSFALVLILAASGSSFAAHTYHTSLTRIDYNAKEKLVEISIQLFAHDLIPALERRAKRKVDLEKIADADKILFDYVNENFVLTGKNDELKKLVFVGKEVSVNTVYVYVETASDEIPENFNLKNTLFFESFAEQTNIVVARFGDRKADLLFKPGDKFKRIEAAKTVEKN